MTLWMNRMHDLLDAVVLAVISQRNRAACRMRRRRARRRTRTTSSSSASTDSRAGRMEDPYLPVPTLRRLAASGAIARTMRPVDPTVTWANHTSMITGVTPAQHGVIFNGLLIRKPGVAPVVEPWRDKHELVHSRTLYDAAHEKGLTTAQVDWVAILNAPSITWEFPERPDPEGSDRAGGRQGRHPLAGRSRRLRLEEHPLAGSDLDDGGGAHHQAAPPQPDAVSPAQPGFDPAPLRAADAGRHGRDGPPRHAGRDDPAGRAGQRHRRRAPRCSSCPTTASRR